MSELIYKGQINLWTVVTIFMIITFLLVMPRAHEEAKRIGSSYIDTEISQVQLEREKLDEERGRPNLGIVGTHSFIDLNGTDERDDDRVILVVMNKGGGKTYGRVDIEAEAREEVNIRKGTLGEVIFKARGNKTVTLEPEEYTVFNLPLTYKTSERMSEDELYRVCAKMTWYNEKGKQITESEYATLPIFTCFGVENDTNSYCCLKGDRDYKAMYLFYDNFTDDIGWEPVNGTWSVSNGIYLADNNAGIEDYKSVIFKERWYEPDYYDDDWVSGKTPFGGVSCGCTKGMLSSAPDVAFFRKSFILNSSPATATLYAAYDDGAVCYVNGHRVINNRGEAHAMYSDADGNGNPWDAEANVVAYLKRGKNVIACLVDNGYKNAGGGSGGFDLNLTVDGTAVIAGGDDDMDRTTKDSDCSSNPDWKWWAEGKYTPTNQSIYKTYTIIARLKIDTIYSFVNDAFRAGVIAHAGDASIPAANRHDWALIFVIEGGVKKLKLLQEHVSWYDEINFNFDTGTWYIFKMQVNGSEVKGKVWRDGEDEPKEWMVVSTFSSDSSSWIDKRGFGLYASYGKVEFSDFKVENRCCGDDLRDYDAYDTYLCKEERRWEHCEMQKIYENGTNVSGWYIYDDTPAGSTISSVWDSDIGSYVINLTAAGGTANGFRTVGNWNESSRHVIQWKMKSSGNFMIYISVYTLNPKGTYGTHRYLYYTPVDYDSLGTGEYIHHGVGSDKDDGEWHVITRDLDQDLMDVEGDNRIYYVQGFLARGNLYIDDILMCQRRERYKR